MDVPVAASTAPPDPVVLLRPAHQTIPIIFASPHSGRSYPGELLAASRLDPLSLRRSEDSFVDELFGAAPRHGAPLLTAMMSGAGQRNARASSTAAGMSVLYRLPPVGLRL